MSGLSTPGIRFTVNAIKSSVCLVLLILFLSISLPAEFRFELIRSIGDNREDYTFFRILAATISSEGEVYVGDSGGHFVARYDRQGRFLGRIGRSGHGPGDFLAIISLRLEGNILYSYDVKNRRIARIFPDLSEMETFRLKSFYLGGDIFVLNAGRFLGQVSVIDETQGKGRLIIFNDRGETEKAFFTRNQWGEDKPEKNERLRAIKLLTSRLVTGYSKSRREIVVGFNTPINPSAFFVYNLEGKLLRSFAIKHRKGLRFPEHKLKFPFRANEKMAYLTHNAIFYYRDNLFLISNEHQIYEDGKQDALRTYCQVLNLEGKVVQEIDLPTGLQVFDINQEGYLVATNNQEDEPRIHLYRLSF